METESQALKEKASTNARLVARREWLVVNMGRWVGEWVGACAVTPTTPKAGGAPYRVEKKMGRGLSIGKVFELCADRFQRVAHLVFNGLRTDFQHFSRLAMR